MKILFAMFVSWVTLTFFLKKKDRREIVDTDAEYCISNYELKELMELSRKSRSIVDEFEQMVIGKFQALMRDFSYEKYLEFEHEAYIKAFNSRVNDILSFMVVNPITGLPNRDRDIERAIDWVFKETGIALVSVAKDEIFNRYFIGNIEVSMFLPDPKLNKVMGFHKPQIPKHDWLTSADIVKNFLIPHPIKTFTE